MRKYLVLLAMIPGLLTIQAQADAPSHPLDNIRDTAVGYVESHLAVEAPDIRISANTLDSRLKLPMCPQALQAQLPYGNNLRSHRSIVEIRCEGSQPWSINVPVNIEIFREVVVTVRPVVRGETLPGEAVSLQRMNVGMLSGGYVTDKAAVIGKVAVRPLQMGQPILSTMLQAATVVRRGQTITMLARQASFEVRSMGESLMDGAIGDRIRVRNRRSQRIVEGVVTENGVVFVN